MPEFLSPADIGNRALQHCGADLMDATLGFTEQSQRARHVSFVYGKLRRAELQRNVWTFATRRTTLRPVDMNTLLLAPTLWSPVVTYFVGSVVEDQNGTLWESKIPNNLNAEPNNSFFAWEAYFGPLTVSLYDSSQAYFSSEVVYTAAGDGSYNVYKSLMTGNTVHPALPNQWAVGTTYFKNNVVQQFPAWLVGTIYAAGAGVAYTDGNIYVSLVDGNIGHIPVSSPGLWVLMPTLTLATLAVPKSISQPSIVPPSSPINEWIQTTTYSLGSFVVFNGSVYVSSVASNTGTFPNASTVWKLVTGGVLYMSIVDLNIGNNPPASPAVWTTVFSQGGGNQLWTQIGGASFPNGVSLAELSVVYPINSGPSWQSQTRNVFHLPAGYLRRAPQAPKEGAISWLGVPGQVMYSDWEYEGDYIISMESNPIVFRFVFDEQDVTKFHDMFSEGLASRIALEVAEPLTQSTAKLTTIADFYNEKMTEARLNNAIEQGAEEIPLEDYIACRM